MKNGALAIFAKTPTLSPVKTRLAKDIGKDNAIKFYQSFLEILESKALKLRKETNLTPYWAIAEQEALTYQYWQKLNIIHTGKGNLGHRLHHIYSNLLKKHDYIIIIGSDSPQISTDLIKKTAHKTNKEKFIIGPALDGGFYLFAGSKKIDKNLWTTVPYSQNNTLEELSKNLKTIAEIKLLKPLTDIDTIDDIILLLNQLCLNSE